MTRAQKRAMSTGLELALLLEVRDSLPRTPRFWRRREALSGLALLDRRIAQMRTLLRDALEATAP